MSFLYNNNGAEESPEARSGRDASAAQNCAGGAAGARCGKVMPHHQVGRKTVINVTEKPKLLHFGLDYLVLLIGIDNQKTESTRLLNFLFNISHNDTNAAEVRDVVWGDTDEEMILRYGSTQNDEIVYVFRGEDHLFSIQKIGINSTMPREVKKKYQFRISFYSWFFGLARLEEINIEDFLGVFVRDIEASRIVHSVSRIDICADLSVVSVNRVRRGIQFLSKRAKKLSILNIDQNTGEPETIYFGKKSNHWKARIYNKSLEIEDKGKERLYPDYFFCNRVTRIEVELHSRSCHEFSVNLKTALDLKHLLMVYRAHLKNKASSWRILQLIEREMTERGFQALPPTRREYVYEQMPNRKFFRATFRKNIECAKRYGVEFEAIQEWMNDLYHKEAYGE